jgi:lysozyme
MRDCPLAPVAFDGVIDASHRNGAIDWPAVAGAGIALAFIKATQGDRRVDPNFERNRDAAARAGILAVPYHFIDGADPDAQADHFLAVADLAAGQPAMLDWEIASPIAALTALGGAVAARSGRDPVCYYGFMQLPVADPTLSAWPLMLPAYPRGDRCGDYRSLVTRAPRLPPGRAADWAGGGRPYDFHQYTPAGRIAGIGGPVDRSIWVGSRSELIAWHATGALPAG